MLNKYLIIALIFSFSSMKGQYISTVTVPEKSELNFDETDLAFKYANTITSEDLKAHLTILASDEFEGRETGQPGNEMASEYISEYFKSLRFPSTGLENTYYQFVAFTWSSWTKSEMHINGTRYKHLWDFLTFPDRNNSSPLINTNEVLFLGYGIDDPKYSDYKGKKLKGKVILIYDGEPMRDGKSIITGKEEASEWSTDWKKKASVAKKYGVKEVLIVTENIKEMLGANRKKLLGPTLTLGEPTTEDLSYANTSYISTTMAKEIMGKKLAKVAKVRDAIRLKGKSKKVCLKTEMKIEKDKNTNTLIGNNVLGYIEGTDKKDELIVVSAHYDHLGKRGDEVYNGADDNGSGTSTVLEIAEAFATAKQEGNGPRRSVLFLLVTGEEKGLLGSAYYAENPVYPLENTICNVNVDMVGRIDEKYAENPDYIYVIGSDRLSSDLHKINEDVNQKYAQLTLDYTYNSEDDPNRYYFRSDHYNFAKNGIPAIFYFNGTHADYHRTSDTVEKIEFEKMAKIGKLIFHTTWELANRSDRIIVDGKVE